MIAAPRSLLAGRATAAATRRAVERAGVRHCVRRGLALSALGFGTSLGDDTGGERLVAPLVRAFSRGINVIDTAITYGAQSCERAVGQAIRRAQRDGVARRDELFIVDKCGYVPRDRRLAPGRFGVAADEIVGGGHCLAPAWIDALIDRSRRNLGLATIDLYLLHNPELHAPGLSARQLAGRLRAAFAALERACADGRIGAYGVATWSAFRVAPDHDEHLELERLLGWAREVGGADHRFAAVEAPFNLAWTELDRAATQRHGRRRASLLACARAHGLVTLTSATLLQGALARPGVLRGGRAELTSSAQRAVDAVLATAGVDVALVGTRRLRHVDELCRVIDRRAK